MPIRLNNCFFYQLLNILQYNKFKLINMGSCVNPGGGVVEVNEKNQNQKTKTEKNIITDKKIKNSLKQQSKTTNQLSSNKQINDKVAQKLKKNDKIKIVQQVCLQISSGTNKNKPNHIQKFINIKQNQSNNQLRVIKTDATKNPLTQKIFDSVGFKIFDLSEYIKLPKQNYTGKTQNRPENMMNTKLIKSGLSVVKKQQNNNPQSDIKIQVPSQISQQQMNMKNTLIRRSSYNEAQHIRRRIQNQGRYKSQKNIVENIQIKQTDSYTLYNNINPQNVIDSSQINQQIKPSDIQIIIVNVKINDTASHVVNKNQSSRQNNMFKLTDSYDSDYIQLQQSTSNANNKMISTIKKSSSTK